MEIQVQIDCDSICRICLREGDLTSIYNDVDKNYKIYQRINQLINFEIKLNSQVPHQICSKCIDNLNIAYEFKLQIQNAEELFKTAINSDTIDDDDVGEYIVTYYNPDTDSDNDHHEHIYTENIHSRNLLVEKIKAENKNIVIEENNSIFEDNTCEDNCNLTDDQIENDEMLILSDPIKIEENYNKLELKDFENNITIKNVTTSKELHKKHKNYITAKEEDQEHKTMAKKNIKTDSSGKPLQICEICGNQYKYKHALECHMRRHRNEKPYPCEICGRAFVMSFELRRHMRTHTKEKPYGCRFCERKFSDFGSRIKHERSHTGERPYVCEDCGKAFAYSHVLASHKLIHTGEKRYGCEICEKRFTKSHHLKAHMNTHFKNKRDRKIIDANDWNAIYGEVMENEYDENMIENKDEFNNDNEINLN